MRFDPGKKILLNPWFFMIFIKQPPSSKGSCGPFSMFSSTNSWKVAEFPRVLLGLIKDRRPKNLALGTAGDAMPLCSRRQPEENVFKYLFAAFVLELKQQLAVSYTELALDRYSTRRQSAAMPSATFMQSGNCSCIGLQI